MFKKILIANRGEIAVRVIHACREMDIATVAIYSDADATARHVWLADEAVHIGPAPAAESYLCMDKLVAAGVEHGCDAVHPGYGFLAENADFAEAVRESGLCFIGPAAQTIRTMGSKIAARRVAMSCGVPVIPGYQEGESAEELIAAARELGFPLLVKAAAGGGGKGMHIVSHPDALETALESARREAQQAFGDDRLFLEKRIEQPLHVEFQLFGDSHGHIVHLFERDCSIQRRHQKIIEETPSPFLHPELRQRMGEAAVALARAVQYENAGTVEFLVDADGQFYFLEMNTRLQVEHPITELVAGVDLVKTQIRTAAGAALPFTQRELSQRGHAIECRIYAEDAANGFLPSTGTLQRVVDPTGPGVRVDSGVQSGDEITHHYDPLLAKLVAWGADRQDALQKMRHALRQYVILGDLTTNVPFLMDLLRHPAFTTGHVTTNFIREHFSGWRPATDAIPHDALIAAALAEMMASRSERNQAEAHTSNDPYSPWRDRSRFRLTNTDTRSPHQAEPS